MPYYYYNWSIGVSFLDDRIKSLLPPIFEAMNNVLHPQNQANIGCGALLSPLPFSFGNLVSFDCNSQFLSSAVCSIQVEKTNGNKSLDLSYTACAKDWILRDDECLLIAYDDEKIPHQAFTLQNEYDLSEQLFAAFDDHIMPWLEMFLPFSCVLPTAFLTYFDKLYYGNKEELFLANEHTLHVLSLLEDAGTVNYTEDCKRRPLRLFSYKHGYPNPKHFKRDQHFECSDGVFVGEQYVCDGADDCEDGEDEDYDVCLAPCGDSHFCEVVSLSGILWSKPTGLCVSGQEVDITRFCDGVNDCLDGSDEVQCSRIRCNINQKPCNDGTCINLDRWCDQVDDCFSGEDEADCTVYSTCRGFLCDSGLCLPKSKENNLRPDCDNGEDEEEYKTLITRGVVYQRGMFHHLKCPSGHLPCLSGHRACFSAQYICVYDVESDGTLSHCASGAHLRDCHAVRCPTSGMYHCEDSYCIGLHRVCDGVIDCQFGDDEVNCPILSCHPGFFKCKGKVRHKCLHPRFVCDGVVHCSAFKDDEFLCDVTFCPPGCACNHEIIVCEDLLGLNIMSDHNQLKQIKILSLVNNSIEHYNNDFERFCQLRYLDLSHNKVRTLTQAVKQVYLVHFDLSWNCISNFAPSIWKKMPNLKFLYLQHNALTEIPAGTFLSSPSYFFILNISSNPINNIRVGQLDGLSYIQVLSVLNISLKVTETGLWPSDLVAYTIETEQYFFKCLSKQYQIEQKDASCFYLFVHSSSALGSLLTGFFIMMLTIISASILLYNSWRSTSESVRSIIYSLFHRTLAEMLHGLFLISLFVFHTTFEGVYLYQDWWKTSSLCSSLQIVSGLSILLPPLFELSHHIFRRKMLAKMKESEMINHQISFLILALMWGLHVTFLTAVGILIHNKDQRYCFAMFWGEDKKYISVLFIGLSLIYHFVTFAMSTAFFIKQWQKISAGKDQFHRNLTLAERHYLVNNLMDNTFLFLPCVILIAMLNFMLTGQMSLVTLEVFMIFGFSGQYIYRTGKYISLKIHLALFPKKAKANADVKHGVKQPKLNIMI